MDNFAEDLKNILYGITDKDLTPFLTILAALIRNYIDLNFAQHGRWDGIGTDLFSGGNQKWKPLASSTQKQYKRKGYLLEPTLYRTGQLYRSIEVNVENDKVVITVGSQIGEYLQYGTKRMPARPFISLTPQDVKEIVEDLERFIFS
jgi:phage gpG-like protein